MNSQEQRINDLMTEINNLIKKADSYDTAADTMWESALAAFNFAAREVGATGFQASWAALKFYGEAMNIKGPFLMLKTEDALYPQYDLPGRLQAHLDEQHDWLRDEARKKLASPSSRSAAPAVVEHWRKLAGDPR